MGQLSSKVLSFIKSKYVSENNKSTRKGFRIVPRSEWDARPPRKSVGMKHTAETYDTVHAETEACTSLADCTKTVKRLQNVHMDKMNLDDIGYSFLVGGDGSVFEGRGWKTVCNCKIPTFGDRGVEPEEIRDGLFPSHITVAYIGKDATDVMKDAVANLFRYGLETNAFKCVTAKKVTEGDD